VGDDEDDGSPLSSPSGPGLLRPLLSLLLIVADERFGEQPPGDRAQVVVFTPRQFEQAIREGRGKLDADVSLRQLHESTSSGIQKQKDTHTQTRAKRFWDGCPSVLSQWAV